MRNLTRDMVKQRAVHIIKASIFKIRVVILDPKAEVDLHMINDVRMQTHLKVTDLFVFQTPLTLFCSDFALSLTLSVNFY